MLRETSPVPMTKTTYKRLMLKLSGEVFCGDNEFGYTNSLVMHVLEAARCP
jgi:uridylate kinase